MMPICIALYSNFFTERIWHVKSIVHRCESLPRPLILVNLICTWIEASFAVVLERFLKLVLNSKQVFRPSHILPKYTVEQQAEWEMADAMNRDKQQKEAERQIENSEANEDPDDDEELGKQRVWDDWKDDHPYGYGNSRLRPCA